MFIDNNCEKKKQKKNKRKKREKLEEEDIVKALREVIVYENNIYFIII